MTRSCSSCSRTGRTRIGLNKTSDVRVPATVDSADAYPGAQPRASNRLNIAQLPSIQALRADALVVAFYENGSASGRDRTAGSPAPGSRAFVLQCAVASPAATRPISRILIVDDDVSVTDTFSRMLRLEGYEVWAALSADEGLTLAQTHKPHAVILDLRMPLTSGLQFLRAIRAIPGLTNTPVAIVTGDYYLDDAQAAEIKALGAELRYKPLWLEELVTLARELLNTPVRD